LFPNTRYRFTNNINSSSYTLDWLNIYKERLNNVLYIITGSNISVVERYTIQEYSDILYNDIHYCGFVEPPSPSTTTQTYALVYESNIPLIDECAIDLGPLFKNARFNFTKII